MNVYLNKTDRIKPMNSYRLSFDPDLLTTFLAVVDAGRISAAAHMVHLSQPAVTARIGNLEKALGVQLLIRSVGGVKLTAAGQKFYDQAKKIYGLLDEAAFDAGRAKAPRGRLVIAASTTIADHLLPQLMFEFKRRCGELSLILNVANTEEVLRQVSKGNVPFGMVEGHARAASLRLEPFIEDEIVLVGPPSIVGVPRHAVDVLKRPLIGREMGSGTRAVVERALRKTGVWSKNFSYAAELGSTEAIKSAVGVGLGLAFVSSCAIKNELALRKLIVIPLVDLKIMRLFYWVLPSGSLTGLASEFYRFAKNHPPSPIIL